MLNHILPEIQQRALNVDSSFSSGLAADYAQ